MSDEWTPQQITIPCLNGVSLTTDALVNGSFAVHQTRYRDGSLSPEWTVTHLPSGKAVVQEARSQDAAQQLAAALMPLADWTVDDPTPQVKSAPEKLAVLRLACRIATAETCWVTRDEVEPHYDEMCSHAVCLEDVRLHALGYDHWESEWDCPSGNCNVDRAFATCEREPGHDGAHQWAEAGEPVLGEWIRLPTLQPTPRVPEPVS